jgi:hypothetical protein
VNAQDKSWPVNAPAKQVPELALAKGRHYTQIKSIMLVFFLLNLSQLPTVQGLVGSVVGYKKP